MRTQEYRPRVRRSVLRSVRPMMLTQTKDGGFSLRSLNPVRAVAKVARNVVRAPVVAIRNAAAVGRKGLAVANQAAAAAAAAGIPLPPKVQAGLAAANKASETAAKVGIGRKRKAGARRKRGGMVPPASGRYKSAVVMRF